MKRITTAALAALALAATIPTSALADDPVSPKQGAVCNLYLFGTTNNEKAFNDISSALASQPAAATFADTAAEFKPSNNKNGIFSHWGMWTGWIKQEKAGTYTFTCNGYGGYGHEYHRYSIWINGQKCVTAVFGQVAFNVELSAGFNSIKVIVESDEGRSLNLTYKKAGSLKDPVPFGPENMFYDDEEE